MNIGGYSKKRARQQNKVTLQLEYKDEGGRRKKWSKYETDHYLCAHSILLCFSFKRKRV